MDTFIWALQPQWNHSFHYVNVKQFGPIILGKPRWAAWLNHLTSIQASLVVTHNMEEWVFLYLGSQFMIHWVAFIEMNGLYLQSQHHS